MRQQRPLLGPTRLSVDRGGLGLTSGASRLVARCWELCEPWEHKRACLGPRRRTPPPGYLLKSFPVYLCSLCVASLSLCLPSLINIYRYYPSLRPLLHPSCSLVSLVPPLCPSGSSCVLCGRRVVGQLVFNRGVTSQFARKASRSTVRATSTLAAGTIRLSWTLRLGTWCSRISSSIVESITLLSMPHQVGPAIGTVALSGWPQV